MQNLIVTDAGLAALINAQHSGTTPIVITHLKLGSAKWRADASATNLKNVTKTFDVQYGGTVDAHTIQVAAIDQSEEQYVAYEMGIFTKDGTLFAIATSNSDPIIQKHASSINEIFCRIVVRSANDGDLQVGDGNLTFLIPQASETAAGIVQFATPEEVKAGTDNTKAISPAGLKQFVETGQLGNPAQDGLDLNTYTKTGNYWVNGTEQLNGPCQTAGVLRVYVKNEWILQDFISAGKTDNLVRVQDCWHRLSVDSGATWTTWTTGTPASEGFSGAVKLATANEVKAGTDSVKAVTPKTLKENYLQLTGGTMKGELILGKSNDTASHKIAFLGPDGKQTARIYSVKDISPEEPNPVNELLLCSVDDDNATGAWLSLRPKDTLDGDGKGRFILSTGTSDKDKQLQGNDDGTLTWNKKPLGVSATEAVEGTVLLATAEEVTAGTDSDKAVTPKALKDAGFITATETANLTRLGLTLIPSVPMVTKTEVTFPAMSRIRLADGTEHVLSVQTSVNMKVQASERHGKDVYVWAGLDKAASGDLKLVTSLNAATFSELDKAVCDGGFHGLCANVGSIENHALSGYVAGDILPRSIWTVNHRPVCAPEGCVWIPEIGKWVQIYLPSWDGKKLVSKFGAVIADGTSEPNFNGSKFAEYAGLVGCELISYDEFTVVAKGSNEGTSIKDAKDTNTTGGHVDTVNRRCVSNYGLEDCCGVLWQWSRTLFENVPTAAYTNTELFYLQDYSWQEEPVYNETYDSAKMGSCAGLLRRALVGVRWDEGVHCGSRAVACRDFSAGGGASHSSRLVSSPKPLPVLP